MIVAASGSIMAAGLIFRSAGRFSRLQKKKGDHRVALFIRIRDS
jgi:hypothetical protein